MNANANAPRWTNKTASQTNKLSIAGVTYIPNGQCSLYLKFAYSCATAARATVLLLIRFAARSTEREEVRAWAEVEEVRAWAEIEGLPMMDCLRRERGEERSRVGEVTRLASIVGFVLLYCTMSWTELNEVGWK